MEFLLKGILVGFAVAAPVGPIGVLCIQRTLLGGRLSGYATGLGAAAADAFYGFIAAFGLQLVGDFMLDHRKWVAGVGGLLLIGLGVTEWRAKVTAVPTVRVPSTGHLLRSFASTFMLTFTNPLTILSFAALFAALGLGAAVEEAVEVGKRTSAMLELIGGVFLGSALWWFILTTGVNLVRHHIEAALFRWLNRISGTALIGFGVYALSLLVP